MTREVDITFFGSLRGTLSQKIYFGDDLPEGKLCQSHGRRTAAISDFSTASS
jgi:hypothetical protein